MERGDGRLERKQVEKFNETVQRQAGSRQVSTRPVLGVCHPDIFAHECHQQLRIDIQYS